MANLAYNYDEDIWEELLDGKVVAMSPRPSIRHYKVSSNIADIFKRFLKGKTCTAFGDGVDVYLTKKDRVIPDAMIVCNKDIIKDKGIVGSPDLLVEVLSPSTSKLDKSYKKDLYERCGVKEYWIVDIKGRSIEVYLLVNNKYELDNIYFDHTEEEIEDLKDIREEKEMKFIYEFKTSLFDDLIIDVKEVFEDIDI